MRRRMTISAIAVMMLVTLCETSMGQESGSDYQYALIEAVKQKNLGNLSEAVKLYRLVIREKPDCAVAYYELGGIYLMTKQVDLAVKNLEAAYDLQPDNVWYSLAYLNALGYAEKYEEAEDILRKKIRSDPGEVEWEYQLATIYLSQGKARKSLRQLDRIEKERGFSEKVTLLKATVYESQEDHESALKELERMIEIMPENIQLRLFAADLCLKAGLDQRAEAYYLDILAQDSMNIESIVHLTDFYRKSGDTRKSLQYLTRSFGFSEIDTRRKMAILSSYLSEEKYVTNYQSELDTLLNVMLREYPEEAELNLMASDFYIKTREYNKAYWPLKSYLDQHTGNFPMFMQAILLANAGSLNKELVGMTGKALVQYPDSTDLRFFRAIGLYETGDYQSMVDNLDSARFDRFSSEDYISQARMLYAEGLYRLEDFARADSLFEALIEEDPDNYMVLNNYSYYLAERGEKLSKARAWSRKAIENNPDNATFLDTYAWVLYKMGLYAEAEKIILKALEKGGNNDAEISEHAGDIQAALNSLEIAKSYYLKAIILGGDKERLEEKIEKLYDAPDQ